MNRFILFSESYFSELIVDFSTVFINELHFNFFSFAEFEKYIFRLKLSNKREIFQKVNLIHIYYKSYSSPLFIYNCG